MIHEHASTVFEDYCRSQHPDAARHWEGDMEFDFVRTEQPGRVIVTEGKWRKLSAAEGSQLKESLLEKWKKSALSNRYSSVDFEVLDAEVLADAFACPPRGALACRPYRLRRGLEVKDEEADMWQYRDLLWNHPRPRIRTIPQGAS